LHIRTYLKRRLDFRSSSLTHVYPILFFAAALPRRVSTLVYVSSCFGDLQHQRCFPWYPLRATSHTRMKALDHGNVRALIGRKGGDRPSSLHTRRWRPKGPRKSSWMKSLHGVLHGGLWIRVHGLPEFLSGPPLRGGSDENYGRPWFFKYFFSMTDFRTTFRADSKTDSRTDKHHQIILLKLINFET
jgi:hypothetical protein